MGYKARGHSKLQKKKIGKRKECTEKSQVKNQGLGHNESKR